MQFVPDLLCICGNEDLPRCKDKLKKRSITTHQNFIIYKSSLFGELRADKKGEWLESGLRYLVTQLEISDDSSNYLRVAELWVADAVMCSLDCIS